MKTPKKKTTKKAATNNKFNEYEILKSDIEGVVIYCNSLAGKNQLLDEAQELNSIRTTTALVIAVVALLVSVAHAVLSYNNL